MLLPHMNWIISNLIKKNSLFYADCTQEEKKNHWKASSPCPHPSPPESKQSESKQNNPPKQTDKQQNYVAIVF